MESFLEIKLKAFLGKVGEQDKLHLQINFKNNALALPVQYNHLVQAAIYSALPDDYARFLHDTGYHYKKRNFKMFSFSRFLGQYELNKKENIFLFKNPFSLVVSSPSKEFCSYLLNGLVSSGYIYLGSQKAVIKNINTGELKTDDKRVVLKTLSPVVAYSTLFKENDSKHTCYFKPGEKEFENVISQNLLNKYRAFYSCENTENDKKVSVRVLDNPKYCRFNYKKIGIKGYLCTLELTGPNELLQMGVDAGIGSKNSQGCGCVKVL